MFCRNVGSAKQLITNCKALLSPHKLQPIGNGWLQFRNTFRSTRHRGKRVGFEPDPLEHLHIESGPLHARGLVKPFLFTVGVSTVSLAGCVIWEYENLRFHASNLLRRPGTWLSVQQKKLMGHKGEPNPIRKWWNSLKDSEKVFYPILAANVLVFGAWRVRAFQPFMVKYFCSNPSGRAQCLPMLLSTFSHYSALHLAANMYVLYSFMPAAIASLGKEQFVAMYLSAGVVSSFASFMYKILLNQPGLSLGASGAIMAVLSYVCVQYPDTRLSIIFLPMYTFAAGSAIKVIMGIDLAGVVFGWKFFDHAAHLGGALFGLWVFALQKVLFEPPGQLKTNEKSLGDIQFAFNLGSKRDFPPETFENDETDEIHQALAKAIYVSGAPLTLLEHPLWKGALNLMNPQYTPPSYGALCTTLLEKVYADIKAVVEQSVEQARAIYLAIDGWTNKSTLLSIIVYASMPLIYRYQYFNSGENQPAALLFKVSEIMSHYGVNNFFGIIADNTENMIKCGDLIATKYPHIMWLTCLAHTSHLLISEIMKSGKVKESYSQITDIISTILQSPILKDRFMKLAEENNITCPLNLPVLDNWPSYISCLHNFLESKPILEIMVKEGFQQLQKYKTALLDESIWQKLKKLEEFLTPLNEWNLKLKSDSPGVHLVHKNLKDMTEFLNSPLSSLVLGDDLEEIITSFNDKKKNVLKPVHFAAAILDPKNHGSDLTDAEYSEGIEYITNQIRDDKNVNVEMVIEELRNYKNRSDTWQNESVWQTAENLSPLEWWQSLDSKTNLAELAMKILSVPATTTFTETSSTNSSTNINNMMNAEVAGKIKFISQNWDLTNSQYNIQPFTEITTELPVINNGEPSEHKYESLNETPLVLSSNQDRRSIPNQISTVISPVLSSDRDQKSIPNQISTIISPVLSSDQDQKSIPNQVSTVISPVLSSDRDQKSIPNQISTRISPVLSSDQDQKSIPNQISTVISPVLSSDDQKSIRNQISSVISNGDSDSISTNSSGSYIYYHRHYKDFNKK